jgi:hypothetical protein
VPLDQKTNGRNLALRQLLYTAQAQRAQTANQVNWDSLGAIANQLRASSLASTPQPASAAPGWDSVAGRMLMVAMNKAAELDAAFETGLRQRLV